jgi:hypothetical protein
MFSCWALRKILACFPSVMGSKWSRPARKVRQTPAGAICFATHCAERRPAQRRRNTACPSRRGAGFGADAGPLGPTRPVSYGAARSAERGLARVRATRPDRNASLPRPRRSQVIRAGETASLSPALRQRYGSSKGASAVERGKFIRALTSLAKPLERKRRRVARFAEPEPDT